MSDITDIDKQPIPFGRHKGKTPEWVSDHDPSYMVWLYENTMDGKHIMSHSLYVACDEAAREQVDEELRRTRDVPKFWRSKKQP